MLGAVVVLLVTALSAIWFLLPRGVRLDPQLAHQEPRAAGGEVGTTATNAPSPPIHPSLEAPSQASPAPHRESFRQLVSRNNIPVSFHGRVVDQAGQALADARIKVRVRHWYIQSLENLNAEAASVFYEARSDTNGLVANSGANRTPIPIQFGQRFQFKSDTCSD
jgi:hypothetical protein